MRHGQGKIVAAAGHQRDLDAAACGFGDGFAVRRGNFPAAVEQRAINIQSDQSDWHNSSVPEGGRERCDAGGKPHARLRCMATHRLYYDDSYMRNFDAQIRGCVPAEPVATDSGVRAAWEVLLDQTAFYPSSGGQPNDLGKLGEAEILDVRDDGEEVLHIVDRELALGPVQGCVVWTRRFDHMQQHAGQHLLSAMFQERFGLPTVSFHLGEELCTIDLRGPEPSSEVPESP